LYDGEWYHNKRHGHGKYIDVDVNRTVTPFFFLPSYPCLALYTHPPQYEGEWRDGLQNGKGKLIHDDGSWYDGDWKVALLIHCRAYLGHLFFKCSCFHPAGSGLRLYC